MVLINLNNNIEEISDEFILYSHNFLQDKIKVALAVIKKYIIDNNLLIVGGTAIDYALKLQNDTLYNDLYQVPDFDIISPNNVLHANNIGKLLCDLKYTNISIVPAIHQTTVRVQLLGFTLFDSTFVPEYIYNKIPYLEYNNLKFVHPNFQKINQYLSLSFLFKITGPSYNVLNRFKKDIERLQLLENYYLLEESDEIYIKSLKKINFSFNLQHLNISEIDIIDTLKNSYLIKYKNFKDIPNKYFNNDIINTDIMYTFKSNFVFHGQLAYNIIYSEFIRIYNKLYSILPLTTNNKQFINDQYNKIIIHNSYKCKQDTIIFNVFENSNIELINSNKNNKKRNTNDSINDLLNILKNEYTILNIKKLTGIIDLIPNYVNANLKNDDDNFNLKIFNLYGNLVSVNLIYDININKYLPVTNYNYNLMYFLTNYYLENDENLKKLHLSYYNSLYAIITIIQFMYYEYPDEFNNSYNFNNSVFNYSLNTNGSTNYTDNYLHFILNFKNLIINNKNLDNLPPKNYIGYPNCEIKNIFNKNKSEYYSDFQVEISDLGISGIGNNYENI